MNSIGSHFFALAPWQQVLRITRFAEALQTHNPGLPRQDLAKLLRRALASMTDNRAAPVAVKVANAAINVVGRGYEI